MTVNEAVKWDFDFFVVGVCVGGVLAAGGVLTKEMLDERGTGAGLWWSNLPRCSGRHVDASWPAAAIARPLCKMRGTSLLAASRATAARRVPLALSMVATGGGTKPANQLQCTVALIKNIVGTGVLTLPAGISKLSDGGADSSEALGLATVLVLTFGLLNGVGFLLIGEACAATSQGSYVGAWRETIGERFSFVPALTSLFLCFLSSVACVSVIADVGTDVLAGLLNLEYGAINHDAVLAAFSAGVLTPLCLLPSLAPLGTASVFGVLGILITGGAMATRLVDGSYAAAGGAFAADAIATPAFHDALTATGEAAHLSEGPPSAGALVFFLSLVSNAYLAHYNAPGVFNECRACELAQRQASEGVTTSPVDGGGGGGVGGGVATLDPSQPQPLAAAAATTAVRSAGRGAAGAVPAGRLRADGAERAEDDDEGDDEDVEDDDDSQASVLLERLTSTLAAEEVNLQFQAYIESVPSFDASSTYRQGYADGYQAGFQQGVQAGIEVTGSVAGKFDAAITTPAAAAAAAAATTTPLSVPLVAASGSTTSTSTSSTTSSTSPTTSSSSASDDAGSIVVEPRVGLAQFRRVVTGAFGASSALFLLIAYCGFATFGDAADPLILNNYASADPLAAVARLGVLLAVLFEFPLLERPFRLTALELLLPIPQFTGAITRIANGPAAAIASVGFISAIAATGVPLDALAGIGGCTGGALLIYIAPALMAIRLAEQGPSGGGTTAGGGAEAAEVPLLRVQLLRGLVALGVVLCAVGTLEELTSLVE